MSSEESDTQMWQATHVSVWDKTNIPFAACTLTWREEHTCHAQLRMLLISSLVPAHDIIIAVIVQEG